MDQLINDVTRFELDDKEVILVGTAHISAQSVETVRRMIEEEEPDVVCVELDEQRYESLRNPNTWENLDLKEVIRNKQAVFLLARLALAAFQRRMGSYTGVKPGAEMVAAIECAERQGAEVVLCDRDVSVTLLRAWRKTPWWKKSMLLATLMAGVFERNEVSEDELEQLRQEHNISEILDELGEAMPEVKGVIVDERDTFMAHAIGQTTGEKVLVVIGAAHQPGIGRKLGQGVDEATIAAITEVPPRSIVARALPWLITVLVISIFVYGFATGNYDKMEEALWAWLLANGLLSGLGALLALGHPLAILTAIVAAPFTSLNPSVGAGMPTALVQISLATPTIGDIEKVGDDIVEFKGWWQNRLTRVLLVFLFSSLGSAIGTFVAFGWLKNVL